MTDINIATAQLRGVLTIFALNKQALLNAGPDTVPEMVRETVAGWLVCDRPFGVFVGPDPRSPGRLNDTYFFTSPVITPAPVWWVKAVEQWERQQGEGTSKVSFVAGQDDRPSAHAFNGVA